MKEKYIFLIIVFIFTVILLGSIGCENDRTADDHRLTLTSADLENHQAQLTEHLSAVQLRGMKLFLKSCGGCHPAGEQGKGPSLLNNQKPDFLAHFRAGSEMVKMPVFTKNQLSGEDVRSIVSFIKVLREAAQQENEMLLLSQAASGSVK